MPQIKALELDAESPVRSANFFRAPKHRVSGADVTPNGRKVPQVVTPNTTGGLGRIALVAALDVACLRALHPTPRATIGLFYSG
jgi:hypothetical protein